MGERLACVIALAVLLVAARAAADGDHAEHPDAIALAAARGCALPVARVMPSAYPTSRGLPAEANHHTEPGDDGKGEEWLLQTAGVWIRVTDTDGDHRPDARVRELYAPDDRERLDCRIEERWSRGRWHLVSTSRFEDGETVTTHFRGDRPGKVERRSSIMQ